MHSAVEHAKRVETLAGRTLTFLPVTNKGALKINHTRCRMDFADYDEVKNPAKYRVLGDPEYGGGMVLIKRDAGAVDAQHRQGTGLRERRTR